MNSELEKATNALFEPVDNRIGNVKFFRGTSPEVTAKQLLDQLETANNQVRSGKAKSVNNIDGDLAD